ncbi:MAG: IclR family transcriptional regulator [Steroidobacteraceae bacterium]
MNNIQMNVQPSGRRSSVGQPGRTAAAATAHPARGAKGPKVTALARGLNILRCFTQQRPELTTQEIVRLTGLPQPTVWRLCRTLANEGFLSCDGESGRMTLGLHALAMGYCALGRQSLPQLALPYLERLTEQYRLGMSIAVRDGLAMLYLQRTHGDFIYFNDPVGARRPFAVAPTGWACYAAYDQDERTAIHRALKAHDRAAWPETEARLRSADAGYRRHGFVLSLGILHEHFNAVATPIRSLRSGTVYGLSAGGLAADWPRKKLLAIGAEIAALAQDLARIAE